MRVCEYVEAHVEAPHTHTHRDIIYAGILYTYQYIQNIDIDNTCIICRYTPPTTFSPTSIPMASPKHRLGPAPNGKYAYWCLLLISLFKNLVGGQSGWG